METATLKGVVGVGIDLIEHARIQRLMVRHGDVFLNRIFTPYERMYCEQKMHAHSKYALRFCAKEAFVKAVGWGISEACSWLDLEIQQDAKGKPSLHWSDAVQRRLPWENVVCHISLTDTHRYAQAMVVLSVQ